MDSKKIVAGQNADEERFHRLCLLSLKERLP